MSVSAVTAVTAMSTMTSVATMSAMAPTAAMSVSAVSAAIVFTTAGAAGLDHPAVDRAAVTVMADAAVNPEDAATGMIVSDPGPSAAVGAGAGGGRSEDGHAHKGGKEQAEQFHDGEQLEVGLK